MGPFAARAGLAILAGSLIAHAADGQTLTLQGQLSSWFILADSRPSSSVAGIRYVPTLSVGKDLPGSRLIDGEVSVNAYGFGESRSWDDVDTEGNVKPYRGWARFKSPRFEVRAGLQKINFGSA